MLLNIKDAPEKAQRIFLQLVDIFEDEEQDISPTPLNYFIWYQYLKGDHPKFRQEMDRALHDPFGYNDRLARRLYNEFFSEDDTADTEFDLAFKRLINAIVKKLNLWSDKIEHHSEQLDKAHRQLSQNNLDPAKLKELTNTVRSTANSMQESTLALHREMMEGQDEIARLRKQLIEARSELMMDELTEVGNRKAFNNAMLEHTQNAAENPGSFSLIMTDIDHFKRFNDTFGHLVGDSVLRYFANIMKKNKQDNETICRYGGEEFAILIADCTQEEATTRAEEIRTDIKEAKLKRKDSSKELGKITASFGVATYRGSAETIEEFIKRADKALYFAKESGRDQVKTENDLTEDT